MRLGGMPQLAVGSTGSVFDLTKYCPFGHKKLSFSYFGVGFSTQLSKCNKNMEYFSLVNVKAFLKNPMKNEENNGLLS